MISGYECGICFILTLNYFVIHNEIMSKHLFYAEKTTGS